MTTTRPTGHGGGRHQDRQIRIVNATTGELLRELTLDPNNRYQPIN